MSDAAKDVERLLEKRKDEPDEFEMTEVEFLRFENIALKKKMMQIELEQMSAQVMSEIRERLQVPSDMNVAYNLDKKMLRIVEPEKNDTAQD